MNVWHCKAAMVAALCDRARLATSTCILTLRRELLYLLRLLLQQRAQLRCQIDGRLALCRHLALHDDRVLCCKVKRLRVGGRSHRLLGLLGPSGPVRAGVGKDFGRVLQGEVCVRITESLLLRHKGGRLVEVHGATRVASEQAPRVQTGQAAWLFGHRRQF